MTFPTALLASIYSVILLCAQVIEGVSHCTQLRSLWLGKNKIEQLAGLEGLNLLEQLDVQNNRLTSLGDCLRGLKRLRELYLACNAISSLGDDGCGLPALSAEELAEGEGGLQIVDLSSNQLASLQGIDSQSSLRELWASGSALSSFEQLQPLTRLPRLTCVYLEHSPIGESERETLYLFLLLPSLLTIVCLLLPAKDFEYRIRLTAMLPFLEQLDATAVKRG